MTKSEKNIYNDPRVPKAVPLTQAQIVKLAETQLKNVPSVKESNIQKPNK